jgi:predicted phosphohydrolase
MVLMHYPPVNDSFESSPFTELFKEYKVETVLYGHLHGPSLQNVFSGEFQGVNYLLTSSDYLNFDPIMLKK